MNPAEADRITTPSRADIGRSIRFTSIPPRLGPLTIALGNITSALGITGIPKAAITASPITRIVPRGIFRVIRFTTATPIGPGKPPADAFLNQDRVSIRSFSFSGQMISTAQS
jgi:hypothetical protein